MCNFLIVCVYMFVHVVGGECGSIRRVSESVTDELGRVLWFDSLTYYFFQDSATPVCQQGVKVCISSDDDVQ